MNIFQKSVLNKYLKVQDEKKVQAAFEKLKLYQNNKEHIKGYKEEVFQDGFLKEIFVDVLGYKLNTIDKDNYNLIREKKNESNSKKADGAILKDGEVFAVIELKDTSTKDLAKVEEQAFRYLRGHSNCKYVIISNFDKLNLYINKNEVDKVEFNLFTATLEEFKTIYLCLQADNLLASLPNKLKDETLAKDKSVKEGLYKDYSAFKKDVWKNLCKNHPEEDKLLLFKKSQKLLDRFLFIFFGEDKGLLQPNSISDIVDEWNQLKELDAYQPLYNRFKKYFEYINTGHKEVFAYNGGLFSTDELLDKVKIDDDLLCLHVMKLTNYDFESDVDVNILGHIFEHSLNEIENITAQLEGNKVDKGKTKQKKNGVFYTPNHITKYIVKNTVGKLCNEKKKNLKVLEIDFSKNYILIKNRIIETIIESENQLGKKISKIKKIKTNISVEGEDILERLEEYRKWLLQITICDPACGSGAFLTQVLDFLISEHSLIDEMQAHLKQHSVEFTEVENHILEKNIYGVDINEESGDIAKLALWLRTAKKGRKLTSLNNNIKCGDSLIDDVEIAGEKAFNWKNEFVEVFEKGGFDVVIGNPPYIDSELMTKTQPIKRKWIAKKYTSAKGNWDIFIPFVELGLKIVKDNNFVSFIVPNKILTAKYGEALRLFINTNYSINELFDLSLNNVFDVDVYPFIISLRKQQQHSKVKISSQKGKLVFSKDVDYVYEENWALYLDNNYNLYSKIINKSVFLNSIEKYNLYPAATVSEAYEVKEYIEENSSPGNNYLKLINTGTIDPFQCFWGIHSMKYIKDQYMFPVINIDKCKKKIWTRKPKIIIAGMALRIEAYLDIEGAFLPMKSTTVITKEDNDLDFMYGFLNSKLSTFIFKIANSANTMAGGYLNLNKNNLGLLPVPKLNADIELNIKLRCESLYVLYPKIQNKCNKFISRIQNNLEVERVTTKINHFYNNDFSTFVKELKKQKIILTLHQQDEWEEYFNTYKISINQIQSEIDTTNCEIDAMVYKLYNLTDEEIKIVEGS